MPSSDRRGEAAGYGLRVTLAVGRHREEQPAAALGPRGQEALVDVHVAPAGKLPVLVHGEHVVYLLADDEAVAVAAADRLEAPLVLLRRGGGAGLRPERVLLLHRGVLLVLLVIHHLGVGGPLLRVLRLGGVQLLRALALGLAFAFIVFLGGTALGCGHDQRRALDLLAVHLLRGRRALFLSGQDHEAKATAYAVVVLLDLGHRDGAEGLEHLLQLLFGDLPEILNVQAVAAAAVPLAAIEWANGALLLALALGGVLALGLLALCLLALALLAL